LRKAFATLIAVYREVSIDNYYGESASVIDYPVYSAFYNILQKADNDYELAFSKTIESKDIYSSEMNEEDKYAAAIKSSIEYFIAAGFIFDNEVEKFIATPDGVKLVYEIIIPGNGIGDHPSYGIATEVKKALESMGITLIIDDPVDTSRLMDKLDSGEQEMWAAAWNTSVDLGMFQLYHSSNIAGLPDSTELNHYYINDPILDQLIQDTDASFDQSINTEIYSDCVNLIRNWAVEVPIYQRQNGIIVSSERVKLDTVSQDITTNWSWLKDIEKLEMNIVSE